MILVNNQGDWAFTYPFFRHAPWNGFLGADIVFPLFLFVAGFAAALKISRTTGIPIAPYATSLMRRSAILFVVGLLLNAWPFGFFSETKFHLENLRIMGVLQRIALCVFLGGWVLYKFRSARALLYSILVIFIVYEFFMRVPLMLYQQDFFGQSFGLKNNFARFVDLFILPEKMLYQVQGIRFDPEGLFTTITALASFLLGALCFRSSARLRFGVLCLVLGALLLTVEPMNKNLWTLPFTLITGAAGFFSIFFLEKIDWQKRRLWQQPILYMGKNPLVLYTLSVLVAKSLAVIKINDTQTIKNILVSFILYLPVPREAASLLYGFFLLVLVAFVARFFRNVTFAAR